MSAYLERISNKKIIRTPQDENEKELLLFDAKKLALLKEYDLAPDSTYNPETGELVIDYVGGRFAIPEELEKLNEKLKQIGLDGSNLTPKDVRVVDGKILVTNPRKILIKEKSADKYVLTQPKLAL